MLIYSGAGSKVTYSLPSPSPSPTRGRPEAKEGRAQPKHVSDDRVTLSVNIVGKEAPSKPMGKFTVSKECK